jgi:uncharacterized protein YggE
MDALKSIGVRDSDVETSSLAVVPVRPDGLWSPAEREQRRFSAHQKWDVRSSVASGQHILDVAMKSGANESSESTWEVENLYELQLEALAKATERAKRQALVIAKGLGVSLVEVRSVTNSLRQYNLSGNPNAIITSALPSAAVNGNENVLRLYPQKVSQMVFVSVVCSIH